MPPPNLTGMSTNRTMRLRNGATQVVIGVMGCVIGLTGSVIGLTGSCFGLMGCCDVFLPCVNRFEEGKIGFEGVSVPLAGLLTA